MGNERFGTRWPLEVSHIEGPRSKAEAPEVVPERRSQRIHGWFGAARSARTRILSSYVILLALSAILSIFAIRQLLIIRLEDRVRDELEQEVRELDRLVAFGHDPDTGEPFESLEALFDIYFARNVPSDDEALLAFVNGLLVRSSVARYPLDRLPVEGLANWQALSEPVPPEAERAEGRYETDVGQGFFRAVRIALADDTGSFIVTILPAEEYQEIATLQKLGVIATLVILLVASVVAWLVTGRVLAPVRDLTEVAQSISQADLARRIEVRGTGEAPEMARSFNAMLDRLESVFGSQREFIQDASHELRDPMTICRGHLELLGDDPEERRRTIELIVGEIDRMGRIVTGMQVLADAEQPDFVQPDWIDLDLFRHELIAKASALGPRLWVLDGGSDGSLFADRQRLTEAVMNLVHNAVQHTVEDDTIAIGNNVSDSEVRVSVLDTGAGISVADQGRIFERFRRGEDAHLRYRGGGLGLAIVKAIAEGHGGRVNLESRLGQGSTFTIVLPQPEVEERHVADLDR